MTEIRKYPGWADYATILGLFLVSSLLGGLVQMMIEKFYSTMPEFAQFCSYTISMIVFIILVVWHGRVRMGKQRKSINKEDVVRLGIFSRKFFSSPLILWGLILLIALNIVVEPLISLIPESWDKIIPTNLGHGGWAMIMVVAAAPLLEEIVFRGVIQRAIIARRGAFAGILITSAIFGIVHGIPSSVITAFFAGIILGYIYWRTGSLLPCIIIHALNNAIAFLTREITGDEFQTFREIIKSDNIYYIVYGIAITITLLGAIFMLRNLRGKDRKVVVKE